MQRNDPSTSVSGARIKNIGFCELKNGWNMLKILPPEGIILVSYFDDYGIRNRDFRYNPFVVVPQDFTRYREYRAIW